MNNKKKDGMTPFMRGLAILLAAAMVASLGIFAQDAYVKASEEVGEDGIVREVADEVVEPAPEPEPVEVVEEIIVELPEPEPEAVEEPAPEVVEEPAPEKEPEAPVETAPVEAAPVEEASAEVEAPAEEEKEPGITDEDFDVEKAYEHYMKLDDAGKEEYLDSLNDEHRKALEDYIAAKEAPAEEVEEAEEAAPAEESEELPAEEVEQPAEEVTEGEAENEETPAEEVEETPAEEAGPEAAAAEEEIGFSSAYLSGKWAGRETSTPRNVDLTVVKDGEVVDRRVVSYNMSMLDVTVAAGDCEVTDVQCSCYTFSGSGSAYTIDMYQDTNVTFSVELTSPVAEEEAPAEEAEEAPAEEIEEAPTEEVESEEDVKKVITVSGKTDIRKMADGLSEIVAALEDGEEIQVLGIEGDWVKIQLEAFVGYIYKDNVPALSEEFKEAREKEDAGKEGLEEIRVTIFSSRRENVIIGETIELTSKVEGVAGYEDYVIAGYQWYCDKGNGFEEVPDGTEETYTFEADENTLGYSWQLEVYYY